MGSTRRDANRRLYDRFWKRNPVTPPHWFSTWGLWGTASNGTRFVEIGPGTRPRVPLDRALFLDLSLSALKRLKERGARGALADGGRLPVAASSADVLVAFDVIEHVERDAALLAEIRRVLRPGGRLLFSVPLHPALFDRFDAVAGHVRRYDPAALVALLDREGFDVVSWCAFGSRPHNGLVNRLGAWWLERHPAWCAWCRDVLFRAVGRRLQTPLALRPGDLAAAGPEVGGVVVLARRR